jgi:tryptophanyl-tRNA synthetase
MLFATGLDPNRSTVFAQSHVTAHAEANWLLASVTSVGELRRMTQFKDKGRGQESVSVGLFDYPVLMAADILALDADEVPVGADQAQHLEIAIDLAQQFSRSYRPGVLREPRALIAEPTATLTGLDGRKMSKSYDNTIRMFAREGEIKKAVMGIVTDSTPVEAPKNPDASSIAQLFSLVASSEETAAFRTAFTKGGIGYGDFKKQLFGRLWEFFAPMRQRREEILAQPDYIDGVLAQGAAHANTIANEVMKRVRNAVGLR